MKPLQKREKVLAAVTGVLLLAFAGRSLYALWQGPVTTLRAQRSNVLREIDRKKKQIGQGEAAEARLAAWNRRSLPSDLEMARSLYQNWLLALAAEAGFDGTKVDAGQGRWRGEVYHALRFSLQAQATLERLTRFLHRFYNAGHLHQIRSLSILPVEESGKVDVQLSIEALVLPGADRKDRLSEEPVARLAATEPAAYEVIARRNLFAAYEPPPPPRRIETPPPPPPFDPAKYAYLTAIVEVGGKPEAWLLVRTTGEKLQLREGETFQVGQLQAKVLRIGRRDVEIELSGQRWRFSLGDNLREMSLVREP